MRRDILPKITPPLIADYFGFSRQAEAVREKADNGFQSDVEALVPPRDMTR
jgi:hypothetical protein